MWGTPWSWDTYKQWQNDKNNAYLWTVSLTVQFSRVEDSIKRQKDESGAEKVRKEDVEEWCEKEVKDAIFIKTEG